MREQGSSLCDYDGPVPFCVEVSQNLGTEQFAIHTNRTQVLVLERTIDENEEEQGIFVLEHRTSGTIEILGFAARRVQGAVGGVALTWAKQWSRDAFQTTAVLSVAA